MTDLAPVLQTRSAFGALKSAVERPSETVDFVSPQEYLDIRQSSLNQETFFQRCEESRFYTLTITQLGKLKNIYPKENLSKKLVDDTLQRAKNGEKCNYSVLYNTGIVNASAETLLKDLRDFILVVYDKSAPNDAYASWFNGKNWYYIEKDDYISQKNLMLINQVLTIQATATAAPSISTISVGGNSH